MQPIIKVALVNLNVAANQQKRKTKMVTFSKSMPLVLKKKTPWKLSKVCHYHMQQFSHPSANTKTSEKLGPTTKLEPGDWSVSGGETIPVLR